MAADVVRVRVAAALVVGDHHVRAELADHRDQAADLLVDVAEREAALGQRRRRVALREPGVDEAEPAVRHAEDLGGAGHLGAADGGHVVEDARPVHRRVEDAAALAAGAGDDGDLAPLVGVAGARGRALAGLVVGVGVHGHHAQRAPRRGRLPRCAGVRRSTSGAAVLPVLCLCGCADLRACGARAHPARERSSGIVAETPDSSVCSHCNSATRASLPGSVAGPLSHR